MLAKETTLMLLVYAGAALFEIAGCYAIWMVLRIGRTAWWIAPGIVSLLLFAVLLTRVDVAMAGRAYAAYGGIYIVASLAWLWVVEDQQPSVWDMTGVGLCIAGAMVILWGRHAIM